MRPNSPAHLGTHQQVFDNLELRLSQLAKRKLKNLVAVSDSAYSYIFAILWLWPLLAAAAGCFGNTQRDAEEGRPMQCSCIH